MNRAINFEKLRKNRQRMATLKRLLILAAVMAAAGAVLLINRIFVEEGLTTTLSDYAESLGGDGFPVDVPGGVIRGVGSVGKNLTVLNDTNLYIYSPKGKVVNNVQRMTDSGVGLASDSRLLTFSVGDKGFAVHSLSRELHSASLEYGILCGDLNEHGDFALVSQVKQFASKTTVYNRRFEEIYSWSSPEYVTNVALSPNGDRMVANCIGGSGGVMESMIYLFRFSEEIEQAQAVLTLPAHLVLDLKFPEEGRVAVLTDRQYLILDADGAQKHSYDFGDRQIIAMEQWERQVLLLFKTADGKRYEIVLLDANLHEKARMEISGEVRDMALSRDSIYVLSSAGIGVYDMEFKLKSKLNKRNIMHMHLVGAKIYYLTLDEICELSQSELTATANAGGASSQTAAQKFFEGWKRKE